MKTIKLILTATITIFVAGLISMQIQSKKPKPSDMNTAKDGTEFRVPPVPVRQVRELVPAKIEGFDVQYLVKAPETKEPKFVLLTFIGQGFILSSHAPRMIIGNELILDNTHINMKGTELYIIIPVELLETKIKHMKFKEVIIENPAGPSDKKFGGIRISMTPGDLLRIDPEAKMVQLVFKDNFYSRRIFEEK
ncbi:MAG: hypothetical protein JXB26_11810 [Candidatus Aminicenantes bacterium]|nr:hypothetical protein [Candidatus Aminicenantes bacterium]